MIEENKFTFSGSVKLLVDRVGCQNSVDHTNFFHAINIDSLHAVNFHRIARLVLVR